jgi:hypothetical protein
MICAKSVSVSYGNALHCSTMSSHTKASQRVACPLLVLSVAAELTAD